MCHSGEEWTRCLSTVLLGLRINDMDNAISPAEYVFGTLLRVPGEIIWPEKESVDPQKFHSEFRRHMYKIRAAPVKHH